MPDHEIAVSMASGLYRSIPVWRRLDGKTAVRYACFEDISSNRYAVQSADYFYLPIDSVQRKNLNEQFIELFIEIDPEDRCSWFDSIEEAIADHDRSFGNEADAGDQKSGREL